MCFQRNFSTDPSGQTNYQYDAWGNVTKETKQEAPQANDTNQDLQTYVTQYQYDEGNRVTQQINPNSLQIDYTRDAIGRITDISLTYQGNTQNVLTNRTYRADGLPTGHTLGNGLIDSRQYDQQGRLTQQEITGLFTKAYSYDANGNVLAQDTTPDPTLKDRHQADGFADNSYTYDVLDRITGENSTLGNLLFTYDANGNRLNKQRNSKDRPYQYNANSNQLISVNNRTLTLDAIGNTLSDRNGKRQYSYNQRNQLATFTRNNQLRASYQYNASNQRTSKQRTRQDGTKQRTFHYQYDRLGNLIGEYKTNKKGIYKPKRSYIWLNNQPVAQIVYKFNSTADIREITYITTDHLNTPRIGTDETQQIAWRWDSDAFGQAQPNKDPDNNANKRNIRLRFPGQYKDGESGLYYNWNRYYDKGLGRYITSDPIGLGGGGNTYGYVEGNPLIGFDPSGLVKWTGDIYVTDFGVKVKLPKLKKKLKLKRFEVLITLVSECIGGEKMEVSLKAVNPDGDDGGNLLLRAQFLTGSVELQDGFSHISKNAVRGAFSLDLPNGNFSRSGNVSTGSATGKVNLKGISAGKINLTGTTKFSTLPRKVSCECDK